MSAAPRLRDRPAFWVATLLGVPGLVLLIWGGWESRRAWRLAQHGVDVAGVVTRITVSERHQRGATTYDHRATVRFTDAAGTHHLTDFPLSQTYVHALYAGARVTVRHVDGAPRIAEIEPGRTAGRARLLLILAGLGLTGAIPALSALRGRRG